MTLAKRLIIDSMDLVKNSYQLLGIQICGSYSTWLQSDFIIDSIAFFENFRISCWEFKIVGRRVKCTG